MRRAGRVSSRFACASLAAAFYRRQSKHWKWRGKWAPFWFLNWHAFRTNSCTSKGRIMPNSEWTQVENAYRLQTNFYLNFGVWNVVVLWVISMLDSKITDWWAKKSIFELVWGRGSGFVGEDCHWVWDMSLPLHPEQKIQIILRYAPSESAPKKDELRNFFKNCTEEWYTQEIEQLVSWDDKCLNDSGNYVGK